MDLVFFIPIVAIVMVFGSGMLKLYLNYLKRRDLFALHHQERMAALEKGIELPPWPEDLLQENESPFENWPGCTPMPGTPGAVPNFGWGRPGGYDPSRHSSHGTLLTGLILLFVSLTLYLALHFTVSRTDDGGDVALFALIPGGIGAAFLFYYLAVGRKAILAREEEWKARQAEAARVKNPPV
jgi:hypothetical protein